MYTKNDVSNVKRHWNVEVVDEMETLRLMSDGCSISRFGDGEIKIILGGTTHFQDYDDELQFRLLNILRSNQTDLLIGVPYHSNERLSKLSNILPEKSIARWRNIRIKLNSTWDQNKKYYSAFVSRPDNLVYDDLTEFYDKWFSLWKDRDVVVVQCKEKPFTKKGSDYGFNSVEIVNIPAENAWSEYEKIRENCRRFERGRLFLIAAGPTATVLSHDLHVEGYQAIDVGHIWRWLPLDR